MSIGLGDLEKYDLYGVDVAIFYGILRAVLRLSVTAVPASEDRLLSSFIPPNVGV